MTTIVSSSTSGSSTATYGATVSVATLLARLRRYLKDDPWQDTLSADVTAGVSNNTVSLTNVTKWAVNDIIEFIDGEEARISPQTMPLSNPVTVVRAHHATTAGGHLSGEIVFKSPRFQYQVLSRRIIDIIEGDSFPYLYAVGTFDITPVSTTNLYPIVPEEFRNLIAAKQQTTSTIVDVWDCPAWIVRDIPTTIAPSGMALRFSSIDNFTNPITVTFQAQLTQDNVPEGEIADTVVLGAAARVMKTMAVELSNRDTTDKNQAATIAELVGEAENFARDYYWKRSMVSASLSLREPAQAVWRDLT